MKTLYEKCIISLSGFCNEKLDRKIESRYNIK
nr:MAG TPA: hypothetical protein [Caudoviricetes sp.]DAY19540.1 MAG TPA: hypothetical protein [Caudoviricetes sp.]